MQISELFYSIQGEGILAGVPSVFIRSSGCNLRCRWCDTPYTSWSPEGTERELEEIVAYVRSQTARHVVITGGEPMIQPEVVPLSVELQRLGLHVTIETAGTVYQPAICDLMSISPKLANSTPAGEWARRHEATRIRPEVLARLVREFSYQLKFVVMEPGDIREIRSIADGLGADASRVVLMPEGTDSGTLAARGSWLAELCKKEGYRLSPRLHIELWGNRRGV